MLTSVISMHVSLFLKREEARSNDARTNTAQHCCFLTPRKRGSYFCTSTSFPFPSSFCCCRLKPSSSPFLRFLVQASPSRRHRRSRRHHRLTPRRPSSLLLLPAMPSKHRQEIVHVLRDTRRSSLETKPSHNCVQK